MGHHQYCHSGNTNGTRPRGANGIAPREHNTQRDFYPPHSALCHRFVAVINSLIWALILVAIVGPGVFAGIIAIGLRSIGFCAKLLCEAIEEIDENQVEAVSANA